MVLLALFPCLVVALIFLFCFLLIWLTGDEQSFQYSVWDQTVAMTVHFVPYIIGGVLLWFLIACFAHTRIINRATGAHALKRKENMRVYNLVENLCMSKGMQMPKINIIEDNSLNAYAGGISKRSYTVALSRGIINKLNDDELESVIAHELSHIRNRDVRLLIVSIVFVGIFAMLTEISVRMLAHSSRRSKNGKNGAAILLVLLVVAVVGYFFTSLMRFAISRKREFLADAGSAEMTKKPQALANALRKISQDARIEAVTRADVAQLFIEHPREKKTGLFSGISSLFATHPPIEKRIAVLEQF